MTFAWTPAGGTHAVQFYESEHFLHRGIGSFFGEAMRRGEPAALIARRDTFTAVVDQLAATTGAPSADVIGRLTFLDVDIALDRFMNGATLDAQRVSEGFADLRAQLGPAPPGGTTWMYGEMVDVLCKEGNHRAALQLEQLWNVHVAGPSVAVLCGYAIDDFDQDEDSTALRSVCRQHTHVIPAEAFSEAPDDRSRMEHVSVLQQRVRRLDAVDGAIRPAVRVGSACPVVYVIDDDASVRASVGRLLRSFAVQVQTFGSAEAFLAAVDVTTDGCVIVDVQLVGMDGHSLQRLMHATRSPMPVIAMSGGSDAWSEHEALRLGAQAFLRKPFDADALMSAITRASVAHCPRV
jgi:CheY-like chemotaxis protein